MNYYYYHYYYYYYLGEAGNVLILGTVYDVCAVSFRYLSARLSAHFKFIQYFWNG